MYYFMVKNCENKYNVWVYVQGVKVKSGKYLSSKFERNQHCKVIIGRNPIEANANTVAIQLPGNPAAYIGKCFTPY